MKTLFEEYGYFIIGLVVLSGVLFFFTCLPREYEETSRRFICALTGVKYDQTLYIDNE